MKFIKKILNLFKKDDDTAELIRYLESEIEFLEKEREYLIEERDYYENKMQSIIDGSLIVVTEQEKKTVMQKLEIVKDVFSDFMKNLRNIEKESGICTDNLIDYYYEKYYSIIEEYEKELYFNLIPNKELPVPGIIALDAEIEITRLERNMA